MSETSKICLTIAEFNLILEYIKKHHRFGVGLSIKYIDPVFDTRIGRYFNVKFRYFGGEKVFDFRETHNMFDDIMNWFKEGEKIDEEIRASLNLND